VPAFDPATDGVQASEIVMWQAVEVGELLVADGTARKVFGFAANDSYSGLVSISPPLSCWG
jgi:hypothetical protein